MDRNASADALLEALPYSKEAEQSVLGAVIADPARITDVLEYLKPESFYGSYNREIFSVLMRMFLASEKIDVVTLLDKVLSEGIFPTESDAKMYLVSLVEMVPSTSNVSDYARIVQEKYYLRSLAETSRKILDTIREGTGDAKSIMDRAEQDIFDIRKGRETGGLTRIDEVIIETYDRLQKLSGDDKSEYVGTPSGFGALDTILTGLNKSDLILVAARPGMGKTSLALNIALNVGKNSGKTVAIVGGGPSGLTAAYFLSLMGHTVTVFERKPKLGGMLRYGIPSYRLPGSYLDRDIDTILSTGVSVRVNCEVGTDVTLEELRRDYDSLYLAIGASLHKGLGIPGEDAKGVLSAIEMLDITIRSVKPDFTGKHVVVVGGGNVAMDATRTAVRLGAASVKCVYRRRISDMTALPEEIEGAMAEGCEVLPLKAPVRIETDDDGAVTALVVQPQVIGEVRGGRPAPRKADQPEERIACDVVLMAVGQVVDSKSFAQAGVPTDHNNIVTADDGSVPGLEGVFSGGDCVSGPATVILAIEAGKVAAASIDEYLGFHTDISANLDIPPAPFRLKHATGRVDLTEREANWRKNDFELMENCMSEQEMAQECSRCLRCDHYGHAGFKGGRLIKW